MIANRLIFEKIRSCFLYALTVSLHYRCNVLGRRRLLSFRFSLNFAIYPIVEISSISGRGKEDYIKRVIENILLNSFCHTTHRGKGAAQD